MNNILEDFPNEHLGLKRFAEMLVSVAAHDARLMLLAAQARRALQSSDLGALRGVRKAYHLYPRDVKTQLGRALLKAYN